MTWIVPDDLMLPEPLCAHCGKEWPEGEVWKLSRDFELICPACAEVEPRR